MMRGIPETPAPQLLRTRRGLMFTALPAIATIAIVGAILALGHRNSSIRDRRVETGELAQAAAVGAGRFVTDAYAVLSTAAAAPVVRRGQLDEMRPYLINVATAGKFTLGMGYVTQSGQSVVSTSRPLGSAPVDLNDRSYVQAALGGNAAVSDVLIAKLSQRPIIAFAYPTQTLRGKPSGLLVGSLALDGFTGALKRLLYAPSGAETIVDGANNVIVGRSLVRGLVPIDKALPIARMRRMTQGTLDGVHTREGHRLVGFAAVPGTGWLVVVDRSYGEVIGPLNTALYAELASLALLMLLGVFVTFSTARRLDRLDRERDAVLNEQRTIAIELQRSLLPDLPDLDDVDIDAGYVPAQGGMSVGGDWYDVVNTGDGRVAVSVGDVAGHGLRAASAMGQLRSAARSLALAGIGPADALSQLSRFASLIDGRPLATVLYAVLDRGTGRLTYAAAGHPPPLLVRADGETSFVEAGRSPLLGVDPVEERAVGELTLGVGDTLIIYTDGLVERPEVPIDDSLTELAVRAAAGDRTAELLAAVVEPRRDDAAVLCLTRVSPGTRPRP